MCLQREVGGQHQGGYVTREPCGLLGIKPGVPTGADVLFRGSDTSALGLVLRGREGMGRAPEKAAFCPLCLSTAGHTVGVPHVAMTHVWWLTRSLRL